jgi:hypothetical protein
VLSVRTGVALGNHAAAKDLAFGIHDLGLMIDDLLEFSIPHSAFRKGG